MIWVVYNHWTRIVNWNGGNAIVKLQIRQNEVKRSHFLIDETKSFTKLNPIISFGVERASSISVKFPLC